MVPAYRANGDYSVNAAFACARAFRTAPKKIADAVSKYIDLGDSYFESCSVAGPGFINFTLGDRYYADILLDIKECGEKYGSSDFGKNKKVNVEFVSANPTGPMHMGNATVSPRYCQWQATTSRVNSISTMQAIR